MDTIVDANHPLSSARLEVENGISGPTNVSIVTGGVAAGVIVRDTSVVVVDGRTISLPSRLEDQSRLIVLSGDVACSDDSCLASDPAHTVYLSDESALEVHGGFSEPPYIELRDDSTVSFHVHDLSIQHFSTHEYAIAGTLRDGTNLDALVRIDGLPSGRVSLHEIPEPASGWILAFMIVLAIICRWDFSIQVWESPT
ncbi:hypothetical protein [Aeoliella sp.]|uniref:hypothetical protein n=1 Tax=Aeoliella sp. TaxID=2795800 RepID=UPI003CCC1ED1